MWSSVSIKIKKALFIESVNVAITQFVIVSNKALIIDNPLPPELFSHVDIATSSEVLTSRSGLSPSNISKTSE